MPTSLVSDVSFVNLGALTTTFTLPTNCLGNSDFQALAATDFPQRPLFATQCDPSKPFTIGNCLPGGDQRDDYAADNADRQNTAIFYHSPGNVCPQGWKTAGVVEKDGDGSLSAEGVFVATEFTWGPGDVQSKPPFQPIPNYLAVALDEEETAIICCPSDLTADPLDGFCKGTTPVESFVASTACMMGYQWMNPSEVTATYTYNDVVVTETKVVLPSTASISISVIQRIELVATRTTASGDDGMERTVYATSEFVGYTDFPAVYLVNKGEEAGDGGSNGGAEESSGGTGNDDGNAASGRTAALGQGSLILVLFWGLYLLL